MSFEFAFSGLQIVSVVPNNFYCKCPFSAFNFTRLFPLQTLHMSMPKTCKTHINNSNLVNSLQTKFCELIIMPRFKISNQIIKTELIYYPKLTKGKSLKLYVLNLI